MSLDTELPASVGVPPPDDLIRVVVDVMPDTAPEAVSSATRIATAASPMPDARNVLGAMDPEIASFWLSALIESAEDAIISKTLNGIITSWNAGAQRLFGYNAEEAIGKPVLMLIPPGHESEEPQILARLGRGERVEHFETIRVNKHGELLNVSLSVSPIRGADGTIIGASKIARDITDIKRTEERLREALRVAEEAREEAVEANRLKDEFLATISHELRTPLTSVLGWTQMLQEGMLEEEDTAKALDTIHRNARAQAQLIEDLLDVSRIITGKMRLDIKPLQLSAAISAAVDSIMPAAEAKKIRLQIILDPGTPSIMGDSERIQQVIWNLLSNAVKFTPEGGQIQVQLVKVEHGIEVSVRDNGKGIQPKFLHAAFDRFSQEDSSSTRTFGGMGMGLSIVKYIVELHGGTAQAFSEGEGRGATFTISLPLKMEIPAAPELPGTTAKSRDAAPVHDDLNGLKLLVVDDERDTADMISTAMRRWGAVVQTAHSAPGALAILDDWLPDIIVTDINMPETDGYWLAQEIRARTPEGQRRIPLVALTAMARVEDRVKAFSSSFQMHVAKPVDLTELRAVITGLAEVMVKAEV